MNKLIVANWKMNMTPKEAVLFLHRLEPLVESKNSVDVVICPPYIDLYPMSLEIKKDKFQLGSQDLHYLDEGPHTGDVSGPLLSGLIDYAIIGHSERRASHGETDQIVAAKVAAAVRNGIIPILCIGDRLLDRDEGLSRNVVNTQLEMALSLVTEDEIEKIVIVYEPVWAISKGDGKGQSATPDIVAPMIAAMRRTLSDLYHSAVGDRVSIIYGGSVNPENAKAYLAVAGLNGLLVGGASLNYQQFGAIISAAQDTSA